MVKLSSPMFKPNLRPCTQAISFSSILKTESVFTMVAALRETRKHSDWPSLAKIAHLHKVEKISTRSRRYPQCTTQAIHLAPLKMNGKHVVARIASLQCKRTVRQKKNLCSSRVQCMSANMFSILCFK